MRKTVRYGIANVLVTLILAALLNLLIFAALQPWKLDAAYRPTFWFSYGALMLAFVLRFVSLYLGRGEASDRRIRTGLPLAFSATVFWGVTLVLSFLYMILGRCGVRVPFALPLITLVFALGFYLIVLIRNLAARPEPRTAPSDAPMRPIAARLRALMPEVKDAILMKKLGELSDSVAAATPPAEYAARIASCMEQLEACVASDDRLGTTRAIAMMKTFLSD